MERENLRGIGVGRPYGAAALALESLSALASELVRRSRRSADSPAQKQQPASA